MDDISEEFAELDDQISQFEFLLSLAVECEFWGLAGLLRRDLAEAKLWRAVFAASLPHPTQNEAGKCSP